MSKFTRKGRARVYFVATLGSASAPDISSEIGSAVNITPVLAEMDGWTAEASRIPTPNMADALTPQIAGELTLGSPTLTIYEDDASNTVPAALARDTVGYIVIAPQNAPSAGGISEVYPVISAGVNRQYTVANEAAKLSVGFALTGAPTIGAFVA